MLNKPKLQIRDFFFLSLFFSEGEDEESEMRKGNYETVFCEIYNEEREEAREREIEAKPDSFRVTVSFLYDSFVVSREMV